MFYCFKDAIINLNLCCGITKHELTIKFYSSFGESCSVVAFNSPEDCKHEWVKIFKKVSQ